MDTLSSTPLPPRVPPTPNAVVKHLGPNEDDLAVFAIVLVLLAVLVLV